MSNSNYFDSLIHCCICKSPCTSIVCDACQQQIMWREGLYCKQCGVQLISEQELCCSCRILQEESPVCYAHALWKYNDIVKRLITTYKISGTKILASFFGHHIINTLRLRYDKNIFDNICIVPIPANPLNKKNIGFDHMYMIARYVCKKLSIRLFNGIKRKKSKSQKTLNAMERRENILRALYIAKPFQSIYGSTVILLDDIITTGSTIQSAYTILSKHFAQQCLNVSCTALTLARLDA